MAETDDTAEASTSTLEVSEDEGHAAPDGEPESEPPQSVEGHDDGEAIEAPGEIDRVEAADAGDEESAPESGEPEQAF